ncbi:MAG: NPCBM/NEW2 domain-containing protein, partial [Bacillota bacterium]
QIGSETIQLPPRALVGLVVCSRSNDSICTATFEHVVVTGGIDDRVVSSGPGAFRGVRLRQGSLVGGQIRGLSDSAVRLWRDREMSVPAAEVSYVQFAAMGANLAAKLQAGRKGVLLANGDFVEGDVVGIEDGRLKLSSVLFGLQRLEMGRVVAAVLREPALAATRYELRVADGSVLLSDRVSVDGGNLSVEVPVLGVLRFPVSQVVEIRAGETRLRSLAEMKPAKVETKDSDAAGPGYVANGMIRGVPMSLGGQACARGIGLQAGTSVTYALDGGYSTLMFRAGVPDGVLATATIRFVVLGDGKELYRSPDRTAANDPLAVTLKVGGVKELMLRVESLSAEVPGACGLIGDPALLK